MSDFESILPESCTYKVVGQIRPRDSLHNQDGVYLVEDKKKKNRKIMKLFYSEQYGPANPNEIGIPSTIVNPYIMPIEMLVSHRHCDVKGLGEIMPLAQERYEIYIQTLPDLRSRLTSVLRILYAIQAMHRNGYLHLDIKYENVVVMDGIEKVTDFGTSVRCRDPKRGIYLETGYHLGTLFYMAPEIYNKERKDPILYTSAVDVWSLGFILFGVIMGSPVHEREMYVRFQDPNVKTMIRQVNDALTVKENVKTLVSSKNIDNSTNLPLYDESIEKYLVALFSSIWNIDPSKRPSVSNIINFPLFEIWKINELVPAPVTSVYQKEISLKVEESEGIIKYLSLILKMPNTFNLMKLPIEVLASAIDLYYRIYNTTLTLGEGVESTRNILAYACFYISIRIWSLTDYKKLDEILNIARVSPVIFSQMISDIYIAIKGDINRYSYLQLCQGIAHIKYMFQTYMLKPANYIPCDYAKFMQEIQNIPPEGDPNVNIEQFMAYLRRK